MLKSNSSGGVTSSERPAKRNELRSLSENDERNRDEITGDDRSSGATTSNGSPNDEETAYKERLGTLFSRSKLPEPKYVDKFHSGVWVSAAETCDGIMASGSSSVSLEHAQETAAKLLWEKVSDDQNEWNRVAQSSLINLHDDDDTSFLSAASLGLSGAGTTSSFSGGSLSDQQTFASPYIWNPPGMQNVTTGPAMSGSGGMSLPSLPRTAIPTRATISTYNAAPPANHARAKESLKKSFSDDQRPARRRDAELLQAADPSGGTNFKGLLQEYYHRHYKGRSLREIAPQYTSALHPESISHRPRWICEVTGCDGSVATVEGYGKVKEVEKVAAKALLDKLTVGAAAFKPSPPGIKSNEEVLSELLAQVLREQARNAVGAANDHSGDSSSKTSEFKRPSARDRNRRARPRPVVVYVDAKYVNFVSVEFVTCFPNARFRLWCPAGAADMLEHVKLFTKGGTPSNAALKEAVDSTDEAVMVAMLISASSEVERRQQRSPPMPPPPPNTPAPAAAILVSPNSILQYAAQQIPGRIRYVNCDLEELTQLLEENEKLAEEAVRRLSEENALSKNF